MPANRRLFLKQFGLGTLGAGLISALPSNGFYKGDKNALPRSTPEQQGISSAGIEAFFDEVEKSKIEFHSIMILRRGHVVAEGWWTPYGAEFKNKLYSLSKSFTSTAVGIAVGDGHFAVDTPVISFFPKELPKEVSQNLAAMKVKDLLTMSTGHTKDTLTALRESSDTWIKTFLAQPVEHAPGSTFVYNTGATYMLSAIIQRVTNEPLATYLKPRLFDPLGITGQDWEKSPQGVTAGGYGLRLKSEDIAKIGQLYLQKGIWNGKPLISSSWAEDATKAQVKSNPAVAKRPPEEDDWAQGYGYQFWRCRPNGYRADGAFGQFSIVIPDKDLVVAITEESFNTQESMNLIWTHLLPAVKDSASLPEDSKAKKSLATRLKSLAIPAPNIQTNTTAESILSEKIFALSTNEFKARTLSFNFSPKTCLFTLQNDKGTHTINCAINGWREQDNKGSVMPIFPISGRIDIPSPVVGSVTWSDEKTLVMTLRYLEDLHTDSLTFTFNDNTVLIKFFNSISQNNTTVPEKRLDIKGVLI